MAAVVAPARQLRGGVVDGACGDLRTFAVALRGSVGVGSCGCVVRADVRWGCADAFAARLGGAADRSLVSVVGRDLALGWGDAGSFCWGLDSFCWRRVSGRACATPRADVWLSLMSALLPYPPSFQPAPTRSNCYCLPVRRYSGDWATFAQRSCVICMIHHETNVRHSSRHLRQSGDYCLTTARAYGIVKRYTVQHTVHTTGSDGTRRPPRIFRESGVGATGRRARRTIIPEPLPEQPANALAVGVAGFARYHATRREHAPHRVDRATPSSAPVNAVRRALVF